MSGRVGAGMSQADPVGRLFVSLGHVRRTPDEADGRAWIIEVTGSGRDVALAGREVRLNALRVRVDRLASTSANDS